MLLYMVGKTDRCPYFIFFYNQPYVDFFTGEKMLHPLSDAPEPKSRHIPSKWEHKRVSNSFILYVTTDSNETRMWGQN